MRLVKYSLILVILLTQTFCSSAGKASILTASSCNQNDVQAEIDSAFNGDTVLVPAGSCTWDQTVNIYHKAITLKGAGEGKTIITDNTPSNGYDSAAITINSLSGSGLTRVSGFEFRGGTGSEGVIRVLGQSDKIRIDHNIFNDCQSRLIMWGSGNPIYGVVDNNTFTFSSSVSNVLYVKDNAGLSWATKSTFGSTKAVYVEANTYQVASHIFDESKVVADGNSGARIVFRYNDVVNMAFIVHGTFNVANEKGTRHYEVYNNNFTFDSLPTTLDNLAWLRGGTGFFFDNTFTLSGGTRVNNQSINLVNYRSCTTYNSKPPWNSLCDGNAAVDNNWDSSGYLCAGQPGAGMNNQSEPLYEFNNFMSDGTDVDYAVDDMCAALQNHIQEGRDFFNDTSIPGELGYMPLTFPHPLTLDMDASTPLPPTALKVVSPPQG